MSSFFYARVLSSDSVVEYLVVGDIDCHVVMSSLVNYYTVDTVVIGDVIFEIKGSLEVKISCDIDSRSVDNPSLVVVAIVFYPSTEVSQILS